MNGDSAENSSKLNKLINASGFLYQMAIAENIRSTKSVHGYTIVAQEHPWRNAVNQSGGFIDLIIENDNSMCFVIECKRSQEATWVPLVSESSKKTKDIYCRWTCKKNSDGRNTTGLREFNIAPNSQEFMFCVVRGSSEGEITLLERIASRLVESVDALAFEELALSEFAHQPKVYIPVIITNANIEVAFVDLNKVSLKTGKLENAKYHSKNIVFFRKTFNNSELSCNSYHDLSKADKERERTVIIINSWELIKNLMQIEITWNIPNGKYPWE